MSPRSHHCNGLPRIVQQRFSPAAEGSLAVSSSCQLTMMQANKLTKMRVGRSVLLLPLLLGAGGEEAADRAELPSSILRGANSPEGGKRGPGWGI